MSRLTRRVFAIPLVIAAVAIGTLVTGAVGQKASVPRQQDKLALGENEVKQLLVLMDADKNGKVTRQEFMSFMEAEFERLDRGKTGSLDLKELTQSKTPTRHFARTGR